MKTRKTVLLIAVAALAAVVAFQLLTAPSGAVKSLTLEGTPDSILIEKGGATLTLAKEGEKWVVGERKYPADPDRAAALLAAVETLKVFDTLGSSDAARFGLGDGDGLTVVVRADGKDLRRLAVGKASSTARQSYVRVDGDERILLVAGNLPQQFGVGEADLRDKRIFSFAAAEAVSAEVRGKETYALAKSAAEGGSAAWKIERPAGAAAKTLDAAKVDAWLASVAGLRAASFAPEGTAKGGTPYGTVTVALGARSATLTVYAEAGGAGYLCGTSEGPYLFYVSAYDVGRLLKPLADLEKK